MNDQTQINIQFKNSVTGSKKIEEYAEKLERIKSTLNGIDKGMMQQLDDNASSIAKINSESEKVSKNISTAFKIGGIAGFTRMAKGLITTLSNVTSKSSSFLEDFNLFQVAFDNNTKEGERFVNTLSEMYGLDEGWLLRTTGLFKQLSNAMGLAAETGDKVSKLMTQMSIDISSLFNIDVERSSSILQSALAGQTKPARSVGADITQATLQTTLDALDLDRQVNQLSYAEKRLLIIISLTDQLSESTNDWGRTLESPANQLRILDEQWTRLTRAVGNVFMPLLAKILPYLNAILMVLTEIINAVAALFGYNLSDYDFFGGSIDSAWDFDDALTSAGESASKLKRGLRGFDKLNVITTPTSSGTSGGVSGGIDPKLLSAFDDAFDSYNEKLEKVQMKATKIRDSIMEWLGFTKQIDPLTGDISWKFDHITSGTVLGALVVGGAIYKGINGILKILSKAGLVKSGTSLATIISGITTKTKTLFSAIKNGTLIATVGTKLKTLLTTMTKVSQIAGGLALTFIGSKGVYESFKNVTTGAETANQGFGKMALSMGEAVAGGALIGSTFGPVGAAVGALGGAVIGATSAWLGYKKGVEEIAYSNVFGDLTMSTEQWSNMLESTIGQSDVYQKKLADFQSEISNLSGTFSDGMDKLELYGIKFGEVGTQITDNDLVKIKSSLEDTANASIDIIEKTTDHNLQLAQEAFDTYSTLSDDEQKNILTSMYNYGENQKKEIKDAQDNITKTYDNAIKSRGYLTDQEYTYIQTQLKKIRDLTNKNMAESQTDMEYYKTLFADKSYKLDEESYKNLKNAMDTYHSASLKDISVWYNEQYNMLRNNRDKQIINEETFNSQLEALNKERKDKEENLSTDIFEFQQQVLERLANQYVELEGKTDDFSKKQRSFIEGIFSNLNIDTRDIKDKFATIGSDVGNVCATNFAKGFNNKNIKFKPSGQIDMSGVSMGNAGLRVEYSLRAMGGLPPVGQLFVANEKGPELIGHIGGQSFVANQNQMMDLLDKKLGNAQSKTPQVFNIYLDPNHKIGTYTLEQLQDLADANGKPITIGG